jgi:hypothetical protein
MKKVILSCAVAAAVCLSFNVNAMHDANHASSSGVGHAVTNSGATKHASTSTGASFTTTVKTDAKKVVAGAKEYGHKAYDATKKTAKSAYDSGKHMLSSGHKASSGSKKDAPAKAAPAKAAPVKAAPVKVAPVKAVPVKAAPAPAKAVPAPAKADTSAKPSVWEKFKGGVSKAYHGTKNTVSGWFSKDNKKDDTSIDAKKS